MFSPTVGGVPERDFFADDRAFAFVRETLESVQADGFARIYVTAGDGGPTAPIESPRIFLMLEPRGHAFVLRPIRTPMSGRLVRGLGNPLRAG